MLKCSSKNNEAALRHTLTHADTLLTLAEIVCKPSKMQIVAIFCQLETVRACISKTDPVGKGFL